MLTEMHPAIREYAKLRYHSRNLDIRSLQEPRPPPDDRPIDDNRVTLMATALLRLTLYMLT